MRKILTRVLESQGYRVVTANDGPEALEKAQQIIPDVILLDVLMPKGMNGFEVCRRLRSDDVLTDVPILLVTALDDRESRIEGIQSGADDFITKPFDPVEIQARVKNITRLNRYRRLLAGELKFEWAVQGSSEGYLILDHQDAIVFANERARAFLGLPLHTRIATENTFLEVARKKYSCEPQEAWENWPHAAKKDISRYLIRPETSRTRAFWLEATILKLPLGVETLLVVRLRDITSQIAAQQDVWNLHAMVLHKLRTPFTSLIGSLDMLCEYSDGMTPDDIQSLAEAARRGAQSLHAIVEGIFKFVESPTLAVRGQEFHFSDLAWLVEQIGQKLGIESVSCTVAPELEDAQTTLAAMSMEAILWEIMHNAQKFHPHKAPAIAIEAVRQGQQAQITIYDDGVSLPPEQITAVWQPYFQGEKFFTGQIPGAGLGLAAVASTLWQIGGSYQISNRPDQPGVIVKLTLPLLRK